MSINKIRGQIGIAALLGMVAPFLFAAIGLSWNALAKADQATQEVSVVKTDVATIKSDVAWIREGLEKGYFNQRLMIATTTKNGK